MSKADDLLYFNIKQRLDLTLIDNAATEVKSQDKLPDPPEGFWKLLWTPTCQEILVAYYSQHYSIVSFFQLLV